MKKDNMRMPFEVNRIRRRPGQSAGEHWRALMDIGTDDGLPCQLALKRQIPIVAGMGKLI